MTGEERASAWRDVLVDLRKRGLKGVKFIVTDDLSGLDRVIEEN